MKAILGTSSQYFVVVSPVWQSNVFVRFVLASRPPGDVFAYVVVVAAPFKEVRDASRIDVGVSVHSVGSKQ